MGQKVNPIGLRLGINRTWDSRWFEDREYTERLRRTSKIREFLTKRLAQAGISRIVIERPAKKAPDHAAHGASRRRDRQEGPGDRDAPQGAVQDPGGEVHLNIVEVRKPEIDAKLVAENIAQQLQRRVTFRRAMKRAVQAAMRLGAQGIRVNCGGRLGGAEIARSEWYREGRVPLHTLRANIDFGAPPRRRPTAPAA